MATSPATAAARDLCRARFGALWRADRRRQRRHHRRLQPGFLRRHPGARQGGRRGDAAGALVLQSQDGARHARHRGRPASVPRRERLCAGRRGRASADDRARARRRAGHAQQPDRGHLSARDHRAPSPALRGARHRADHRRDLSRLHRRRGSAARRLRGARLGQTVVQLYSFSKAYCIPGHRVGALVADAALIAEIAKILDTCRSARRARRSWCFAGLSRRLRSGARATARISSAGRRRLETPSRRSTAGRSARSAPISPIVAHPFAGTRDAELCAWLAGSAACSAFRARFSARRRRILACRIRQCGRRGNRADSVTTSKQSAPGRAPSARRAERNVDGLRGEPEAAAGPIRRGRRRRGARPEVQEGRRQDLRPKGHARRPLCRHSDLPRRADPADRLDERRISATSRLRWSACRWISASPTATARASARAQCGRSSGSALTITCSNAPTADLTLADIGDIPFRSRFNLELSHEDIERAIGMIVEAGVAPLSVGGDHSMTLPILRAVGKRPAGRHDPYRRPLRHRRAPST